MESGEVLRMSFWSLAGKPLDFARGRRICAIASIPPGTPYRWSADGRRLEPTYIPQVIAGHAEHDGVIHLDPEFMTVTPTPPLKPRPIPFGAVLPLPAPKVRPVVPCPIAAPAFPTPEVKPRRRRASAPKRKTIHFAIKGRLYPVTIAAAS